MSVHRQKMMKVLKYAAAVLLNWPCRPRLLIAAFVPMLLVGCSGAATGPKPSSDSAGGLSGSSSGALSGLSGDQLYARARDLLMNEVFRVSVSGVDSGTSFKYNESFGFHGTLADVVTGSFTLHFLSIGTDLYVRGSADFWSGASRQFNGGTLTPEQTAKFAAKWVKVQTAGALYEQFSSFVGRETFLNQVFPGQVSNLVKAPGRPIGGIPTIQVTDNRTGNQLFVSTIDGAILLETNTRQNGTSTFSDYGKVPEPTAPAAADMIDGAPLGY